MVKSVRKFNVTILGIWVALSLRRVSRLKHLSILRRLRVVDALSNGELLTALIDVFITLDVHPWNLSLLLLSSLLAFS